MAAGVALGSGPIEKEPAVDSFRWCPSHAAPPNRPATAAIDCRSIRTHCNPIQTLLQLNSNNQAGGELPERHRRALITGRIGHDQRPPHGGSRGAEKITMVYRSWYSGVRNVPGRSHSSSNTNRVRRY